MGRRGTLQALFTDSHAFVNDDIAAIYGVAAPGSEDLQLVDTNPAQRSGIMTQAGLLASLAHETEDAPVLRGVLILDRMLCQAPPPPPPGVNTTPPTGLDGAHSERQLMQESHALGGCASCHTQIDDIGFAFEHYDAVGAWRTLDEGLPVDSSAQIFGTKNSDGKFDGALDLLQALANSDQVTNCISYEWLRFALGLEESQIDIGNAAPIANQFSASGGNFTELLVAIVKSDLFRSVTTGD